MKKWVLILILIIFSIVGFLYYKIMTPKSTDKVLSAIEAPTAIPTPRVWKQSTVIDVNKVPIRISWAIVNPEDVNLYDNLKEQKLSEEIKVERNCSVLVNGGFYSQENTHLGLFVTNFEATSKSVQNATLNGFLSINSKNKIIISADLPINNPRIALQTGPLLISDSKPLSLAIKNDEPNRRIAAGIIGDNKLIFLAAYKDKEALQGPLLGQLPEIINLFEKQTGIIIVDAINLDGGSASVFVSNYDLLREITHVGSYFCIK
jgi:uncharacterized protein YigE (DUF2233 family)